MFSQTSFILFINKKNILVNTEDKKKLSGNGCYCLHKGGVLHACNTSGKPEQ